MKTKYHTLAMAAVLGCLLTGCATRPVNVSTVGPELPAGTTSSHDELPGDRGYLCVYSDTKTRQVGDNTYYYTHTPYSVYDQSGVRVQWVRNHLGDMDQSPTRVTLPVGHYNVVAESTSYGRVTVPIVVLGGRETDIHLDH